MRIFSDGRIYTGEIDEGSKEPSELAAIEADSFEIADDSAEAIAIRAGGTVTINDFATQDITVEPPEPTEAEAAAARLHNRFDNDDLDATDIPDVVTVLLES
ncbi:MAG: hypothetical protein JSS91_00775 [Bacteroidetes bacterium]|nr:hypothetical protein [Bacteroidota bacterium]